MRRPLSSISQLPSAATISRGSLWKLRLALKGIQWARRLSSLATDGATLTCWFIDRSSMAFLVGLPGGR
ncbi:hypothetical protein D3C80_1907780 [compost metagenome]